MKKPAGRLLLTWNEKKHPEIVEFFDNIEEGLYSHSVREAIKFYMKYKNSIDENNPPKSSFTSFSGEFESNTTKSLTNDIESDKNNPEDNYVDFDVNDL